MHCRGEELRGFRRETNRGMRIAKAPPPDDEMEGIEFTPAVGAHFSLLLQYPVTNLIEFRVGGFRRPIRIIASLGVVFVSRDENWGDQYLVRIPISTKARRSPAISP